jgi:hypothetical protein
MPDCYRKAAGSFMKKEIEAAGYELAKAESTHIAAAIGSGVHAMMAELFKQKMSFGQMFPEDAYAAREKKFRENLDATTVGWDQITPHLDTARAQMLAICRAFMPIAELTQPVNVEDELEYLISPLGGDAQPILLTGHRDVRDSRDELHDHKTGSELPLCFPQLGGYTLLSEYNGQRISNVRVNFAPRLPLSKLHECEARSIRLDRDVCVDEAWSGLKAVQLFYNEWLETKEPSSFPANNKSRLCGKKYCTSWGTGWCRVGCVE